MMRFVFAVTSWMCVRVTVHAASGNTSLSETLFFFMCWCNPIEVQSIPECTQRLSHLTSYGGQHGQESEESEEGEVRSEEDCEEDPQGRQEEEVTSLLKLPAPREPARHQRLSKGSGRR